MSNHQQGKEFETHVARLLKSSTGYKNVREQQHICGKNVDIIFEKQWNPHKYLTIAVECKNWRAGLDREAIKDIYFDYKPLFDQKKIDELWIVAPNPVSATVQEHIDAYDGIEILHLSELEQDIIDFTLYATYLQDRFRNDPLSKYYIPSRLEQSATLLHSTIQNWLVSVSAKPVAIWAGYGMGKTSYASYLAAELAATFLKTAISRIPILIPLGDFYTAPRLDGLFANVLTKDSGVHGYNFNTFWNLHEAGRFVIILDGFDEMKHAMTKSEFVTISKEIRKLCLPNSRILLLGRPDAIVSGEEHNILIRGTRTVADLEISDNMTSEFDELRLDFFSEPEYREFLRRYIDCFYTGNDKDAFIAARLDQVQTLRLDDLVRRPVQARMLAQILLNPKNSLDTVSRYDLYNMFIDDCFAREEEKPERRKTERSLRKRFMQDIAWWLWAIKRTRTFTVNDIPLSLASKFISPDGDQLGQLREFLVASVVEEKSIGSLLTEKGAGTFYFPHLSFTEFLVSEYVVERELTHDEFGILANSFDAELKSFIESYKNTDGLNKLYRDLRTYTGELPWHFLVALSESRTLRGNIEAFRRRTTDTFWTFAVDFLVMLDDARPELALLRCSGLIRTDNPRATLIASQLLIKMALDRPPIRQRAIRILLGSIFRGLSIDKLASTVRHPFSEFRIASDVEDYFVSLLSKVSIDHTDDTFAFDLIDLYAVAFAKSGAIKDEHEYPTSQLKIKWHEVAGLLDSTAANKLVSWAKAVRSGLIFEENRGPKQAARSRPRFIWAASVAGMSAAMSGDAYRWIATYTLISLRSCKLLSDRQRATLF